VAHHGTLMKNTFLLLAFLSFASFGFPKNNCGSGTFVKVPGTPLDGVYVINVAFSDVNGDSDQDVLITGRNAANQTTAMLYQNRFIHIYVSI